MNLDAILKMVTGVTQVTAAISALSGVLHALLSKEDPTNPVLSDLQRIMNLNLEGGALAAESQAWLDAHPTV